MSTTGETLRINYKARLGLALIVFVLLIQAVSLFRSLPDIPACGKIQNLGHGARVLINCDSAVFMKDAQNPLRLLNGQSVYQDRPLYATTNWLLSTFLTKIGIPSKNIVVTGNSGVPTSYSEIFYLSYLFINFLILLLSVFLFFKWLQTTKIWATNRLHNFLLVANALLILIGNELTKTFFWTPHSQMFNLLLPCYALYLISTTENMRLKKNVFLHCFFIGIGLLFYSLLAVLYFLILTNKIIPLKTRLTAILTSLLPWILFPISVKFFGGTYKSIAISRYRLFVWLLDGIKNGTFFTDVAQNAQRFFSTIPIIPALLIVICFLVIQRENIKKPNFSQFFKSTKFQFSVFYMLVFAALGYYARRVTLGPIIFIELTLFATLFSSTSRKQNRFWVFGLWSLLVFQVMSWIFTMGPME